MVQDAASKRVSSYIKSKGWSFSLAGSDEFQVMGCPICGDNKGHFFINQETGLWHCKHCTAYGNLYTLKRALGDLAPVVSASPKKVQENLLVDPREVLKWHGDLLGDQVVLDWLHNRQISDSSITKFRLGVKIDTVGRWLAMPYFSEDGVVNVKFRALPPSEKTFRWVPDHPKPLFNVSKMDPKADVIITEGELDAIRLDQEGYENVVSIPSGSDSFSSEHWDSLISNSKVYLVFDNDVAGRRGAKAIAERLDVGRCRNVILPVNDPTDFFMAGYAKEYFDELLYGSKAFGRSTVLSVPEVYKSLEEMFIGTDGHTESIQLPWKGLHKITGPLEPGFLVTIMAHPGQGKTTFCLNIVQHLTVRFNIPCYFMCLEMRAERLLMRLISSVRAVNVRSIDLDHIRMSKRDLSSVPLFLSGTGFKLTQEKVFDTIRYIVKRSGVKFVVFDHLHFLCRSLDNLTQEIGVVTRDFKCLAEELNIIIMMVVHPRKAKGRAPTLQDIKDSASPAADSDVIISLYRRPITSALKDGPQASHDATASVRVVKTRYAAGGAMTLSFVEDSMQFVEQVEGSEVEE